ncbi:MAG TPA: TatD family hydrolase [Planctomycetaceae bacterium]|jgi:TatD DNase family protein|nr:TatD family hydrolase [Planctomycetaceae bacterium]
MLLIDTHCHLDEEAFDVDRPEVVARAREAGVARLLTIGTTAGTSRRAVEIAAQFPTVFAVVGIQPNYAAQAAPGDWELIEQLSGAEKVVGIGETGLDRYWDYAPLDVQVDYFRRHLALSQKLDLPFVVHCRDAEADVLAELRRAGEAGPLRGVMHSFSGGVETARACLDLGLLISFAGMVTFKKSQGLREVVREIPLDRLLVETDAPYLAPQPMRGKRNEPAFVKATAECLADLLAIPLEELARRTSENACRLFRLTLDEVAAE